MAKKQTGVICAGSVETEKLKAANQKVKAVMESYKDVNLRVSKITDKVKENWVGKGRNEFESQYNLLIRKIEDFGDTLEDIYEGLVSAEVDYGTTDNNLKQDFYTAMDK